MEDLQNFNLSKLIKFLHRTLILTEEVKTILKTNCEEAMYCLQPWCVEVNPQQEVNKNVCTCLKSKDEDEEIAADISRTLLQTQQLREKSSLNIKNQKFFNKHEYYQKTENKKKKKIQNLNVNNKNMHLKQDFNAIKQNNQNMKNDKEVQNEIDTYTIKKTKNNNQLLINSIKFTETKNFLAINKRNVKNIEKVNQCKSINHKLENKIKSNCSIKESKYCKSDEKCSATSISELKNLIQKMSIKSNDCTLINKCNIKCPLHENAISQCTSDQKIIIGTIIDNFNRNNISEEIIKSLKIYHTYLNIDFTKKLFIQKHQKILHIFLIEFNKMNEIVKKKSVHKNISSIFSESITLFESLFSKNIKVFNLKDIRAMYAKLNSAWKMYEVKKFNNKYILKNESYKELSVISNVTQYMSNGIWNLFYNSNFEGMSEICCIRYTNKDQLLLFFDIMQKFQYIQYYNDLIKIIIEDILPNMKIFFDYTQLEYVKIYKMIFILYQGLDPKIPILVRINK
ncbi:hypothetical protein APICC_04111 [Apis cerana cerana]|uniref:Uncharacterized protein n=2 Tax=Apis cerana TaxID=7461 RepID=A0A2A3E718_APICC|nr:hypothetical protein APICC_04111 [Apis cerana cerana]